MSLLLELVKFDFASPQVSWIVHHLLWLVHVLRLILTPLLGQLDYLLSKEGPSGDALTVRVLLGLVLGDTSGATSSTLLLHVLLVSIHHIVEELSWLSLAVAGFVVLGFRL